MITRLRAGMIAIAITALAAVSLGLVTTQSNADGGPIGEPFPQDRLDELPDYARAGARIVTNPDGTREVVFKKPEIQDPEVRAAQRAEAIAKNDVTLLPYCAPEDKPGPSERRDPVPADREKFPLCRDVVSHIFMGPPGARSSAASLSTSDSVRYVTEYSGSYRSKGISGVMEFINPPVNHNAHWEGVAQSIGGWLYYGGGSQEVEWLEIGMFEGEWKSETATGPKPYWQNCSSDSSSCSWPIPSSCDTTGLELDASMYLASDGTWRVECWNGSSFVIVKSGVVLGDGDNEADGLSAQAEFYEDLTGPMSIDPITFTLLQLFNGSGGNWDQWDTTYSSNTTEWDDDPVNEYARTTTSSYTDWYVDD